MAVFLGRLVPALRTLVSVPAGVAGMAWPAFLLWSAAGSALWNALLMGIGYALGNRYQEVTDVIDWITRIVLGLLVLLYLWRVVRPAKKPESL
jgi:membrane protein DedA with SNARE-associated domain